jgi:hypothetical protein
MQSEGDINLKVATDTIIDKNLNVKFLYSGVTH